ncbi:D-allose transporter ATP-binding protein [Anopheles sinensis]|uniref:D-allose transporter ATP-binding protein n=1 Tax=Anopheles sinensis TaxID=74873 RepID=A0A084VM14_ANOSI|nr:D-allose transporter ATP-binding protein [Anopheles sinensis]
MAVCVCVVFTRSRKSSFDALEPAGGKRHLTPERFRRARGAFPIFSVLQGVSIGRSVICPLAGGRKGSKGPGSM